MKKIICWLLVTSYIVPINSKIADPKNFIFDRRQSARNSYISVLHSADNEEELYILKQKKAGYSEQVTQLLAVFDAIGCDMVNSIQSIPSNKILIVPAALDFPGKHFPNRVATVHTYIPAKPVKQGGPFKGLKVNQYFYDVPRKSRGLSKSVVSNMTWHPDVPVLCAIDTFTGNSDRCCDNLVYDSDSGRFFAFDFSEAFNKPLTKMALMQVTMLKEKGARYLSPEERVALISYRNAMAGLVARNYPTKVLKKIDKYVHEMFGDEPLTWAGAAFLNKRKQFIKNSYYYAAKLVVALNDLIGDFDKD